MKASVWFRLVLLTVALGSLATCVIDRRAQPAPTSQPATAPTASPSYGGGGYVSPTSTPTPYVTPEPAPTSTPTPTPAADGATSAFAREFLTAHNTYRARHCASPLTWSDELARYAARWAEHLRGQGCGLTHSSGSYGENLAGGTASALSPQRVTTMWYDEVAGYSYGSGFSMSTGHFTQVVWRGTQRLGCAMATCGGNAVYVCSYDPPGNYSGDFPRNVVASCP
ncbi:MAG: hypothetical protein IPL79_12565 [Myxococcales bacterium]|nr:hypothetical protein [Myxococcales bacterium]